MANTIRQFPSGMPTSFRYEPQTAAYGNGFGELSYDGGSSCGAREADYAKGLDVWQKWYDASGVPVPTLTPGSNLEVSATLTADHGGLAWFMVACGTEINEQVPWTFLERAASDRDHHFMPSNPGVYAWKRGDNPGKITAQYTVPADLSCADGRAVGRWLWKTGNSCADADNYGRSTETFVYSEYEAVAGGSQLGVCGQPPEVFISCVDFLVTGSPGPSPVPSQTTLSPNSSTSAPQPSPSPTNPAPTPQPAECTREDDCGINPWCNDDAYFTWCAHQWVVGSCPAPHCTLTSPEPEAEPEQEPEPEGEAEPEQVCTVDSDCGVGMKCCCSEVLALASHNVAEAANYHPSSIGVSMLQVSSAAHRGMIESSKTLASADSQVCHCILDSEICV